MRLASVRRRRSWKELDLLGFFEIAAHFAGKHLAVLDRQFPDW
jgi:hypothetical protein